MAPKACETMALWHDSWFTVHRTAIYRHYSKVSSFGSTLEEAGERVNE